MVVSQNICTKHTFLLFTMTSWLFKLGRPGTGCKTNLFVSPYCAQAVSHLSRQTIRLPTAMDKGPCGARHWVIRAGETQQSHLAPGGLGSPPVHSLGGTERDQHWEGQQEQSTSIEDLGIETEIETPGREGKPCAADAQGGRRDVDELLSWSCIKEKVLQSG